MSTIEDRLSAALEARAEQVQPEDLRPADVPRPASVTWLRHPATYVAAAAACAAVIAAPFLVNAGDDAGEPSPAPAPSVVPTALPPQADIGADWPSPDRPSRIDVDGDGTPDVVRVRAEPGEPLIGQRLRVEAELSSTGAVALALLDSGEVSANIFGPAQLDGDPGKEVLVYRDGLSVAALDLAGDRLVEPDVAETPPLLVGIVEEPSTGRGFESRVWVQDGTLSSYLSDDSFSGGNPLNTPMVYPVSVTTWSLEDGALVPSEPLRQCVDVLAPFDESRPVVDCADGAGEAIPAVYPEVTERAQLGDNFEVEVGGGSATVSLEGTSSNGTVEEGDAEVVVTLPGGATQRLAVEPGWEPAIYTTPVSFPGGELSLLVTQEGGDSNTMTLLTVRDGRLMAARTEGPVPFGNGFIGSSERSYQTWIGPDGALFTRIANEVGPEGSLFTQVTYRLYRWALGGSVSIEGAPTLQALSEGCFAMDDAGSGVSITRC